MVRPAGPSFPDFTPTSGNLSRRRRGAIGGQGLRHPRRPAMTYAEAERESAQLAKGIALPSGVGKGTACALLAPNGPDSGGGAGWRATRIGAVVALINTYNKAKRARGWVLRHSDARSPAHRRRPPRPRLPRALRAGRRRASPQASHEHLLLESHPFLRSVWTWGDAATPVGRAGRPPWPPAATRSATALLRRPRRPRSPRPTRWRSCTRRAAPPTPKGAVHRTARAVRHAHNLVADARPRRRRRALHADAAVLGRRLQLHPSSPRMHAGATVVFEEQFEPGATLELIERERITQVMGWPHMAKALVDHPTFKDRDLSSVRYGRHVGASCPRSSRPTPTCPRRTASA